MGSWDVVGWREAMATLTDEHVNVGVDPVKKEREEEEKKMKEIEEKKKKKTEEKKIENTPTRGDQA